MKFKTFLAISTLVANTVNVFGQEPDLQKNTSKSEELANWIMKLVIEKGHENERIKRQYVTYDKRVIQYNLAKNPPQVLKTSVYRIYGENGQSMERLTEKDGRTIRNARPEKSGLDFNDILMNRYDFNLEREEMSNGRGEYVISFKPKEPADKLPVNDRLDEGMNRATGLLYIDMEKFYLRRLEGGLTNSFTKALSIFEMKDFTITLDQEEFGSIVVPGSLVLTYRYRVFWGETTEKLEYSYSDRVSSYVPPPKH